MLSMGLCRAVMQGSLGLSRSMAYHPEFQHMLAEMVLAFDPIGPHLDQIAADWSNGVDHGAAWPSKIVPAKYHAVEACWRIVDKAMEVSGGPACFAQTSSSAFFVTPAAAASIQETPSS